jgi:8-oxo-dGTP pyrophosphatase MutT (NUDIX family)
VILEVQDIIAQLKIELKNPLPGESAHRKMLPPDRSLELPSGIVNIKQAGVLLLLFPEDGKLKIVFIRRPSSMKHHADQIAFPGGRLEITDKDLTQTALREASEEIGLYSDEVEIIGQLSPLYVRASNFSIQAFVGWSQNPPLFKINNNEVADIHIFAIDDLVNPGSLQNQKVNTTFGVAEFPGYMIDDIFIWGATAMIISEFIQVYNRIRGT